MKSNGFRRQGENGLGNERATRQARSWELEASPGSSGIPMKPRVSRGPAEGWVLGKSSVVDRPEQGQRLGSPTGALGSSHWSLAASYLGYLS